jgi:hypothetical protein
MAWRGSPTGKDKFLACLTYLVPLLEVIPFGSVVFSFVPALTYLLIPLSPLLSIYYYNVGGFNIVGLVVFIALYAGVAQNPKMPHFLRYNAMQALLLAVLAWLCSLVLSLFGISLTLFQSVTTTSPSDLVTMAILTVVFIFIAGSCIYAIVQCIRGLYAEKIPIVSETAYTQVR